MHQRGRQQGLTIIGFVFVAAVIVTVAVVGFRVMPAYIEYFSIQKAMEQALMETKDYSSPAEVRKAFQRRVDTGYIESVRGTDLTLTKEGNQIVASASWTRTLPLIANASLLLEFEASAAR
jgi:Tfp pilus assembly major pilin PilA